MCSQATKGREKPGRAAHRNMVRPDNVKPSPTLTYSGCERGYLDQGGDFHSQGLQNECVTWLNSEFGARTNQTH